jgi:hypothetical protein
MSREARRADGATRLRPACPGMPPQEFDALVARIVDVQLEYEAIERRSLRSRRALPQLDDAPSDDAPSDAS